MSGDDKEVDFVMDMAGAAVSAAAIDRTLAELRLRTGEDMAPDTCLIVSHPLQRTYYIATGIEVTKPKESSPLARSNGVVAHNGIEWLLDLNFPPDRIRIESQKRCALIKNLATY